MSTKSQFRFEVQLKSEQINMYQIMKKSKKNMQGFIALSSVLIISAVVLAVTATVSLLGIGEGQSGLSIYSGEKSYVITEGCMEDALLKTKQSATYAGGTITRPEGTCVISVSKVGNIWTLTATTQNTAYNRTIEVVCNRSGSLTLLSWKEI